MISNVCVTGILFAFTLVAQTAFTIASREARLAEVQAVYTDKHPAVRKAGAELELVRRGVADPVMPANKEESVALKQARLADLR